MKTKARKPAQKAERASKARINKLPKGASLVVPVAKRKVVTHTIQVPKDADEIVVRIVLGGGKLKALAYIEPTTPGEDDPG